MTPVVFTDLDGTLLDRDTYSWHAAEPALDHLRRHDVPCIVVTSKTRAEVELWRSRLDNNHPFIVENGGAAFIPYDYFPFPISDATDHSDYLRIEWGTPYPALIEALEKAVRQVECQVQSFHEMTAEEVAEACSFPLEEALLALWRDYDEPFRVLDPRCAAALEAAIEEQGLRAVRGGRFHHICGKNDKAVAVQALSGLFRQGDKILTIGLGDSWNDLPFLKIVDLAVIVRSPAAEELQRELPQAILTRSEGPEGWNEAVLRLIRPT